MTYMYLYKIIIFLTMTGSEYIYYMKDGKTYLNIIRNMDAGS